MLPNARDALQLEYQTNFSSLLLSRLYFFDEKNLSFCFVLKVGGLVQFMTVWLFDLIIA